MVLLRPPLPLWWKAKAQAFCYPLMSPTRVGERVVINQRMECGEQGSTCSSDQLFEIWVSGAAFVVHPLPTRAQ